MGLSDEERMSKLFFSMKRMNNILKNWNEDYRLKEERDTFGYLKSLVDQTFPALFENQSNGLHWFMGSSTSNVIKENMQADPWGLAIGRHLTKTMDKDASFWEKKSDAPWEVEDGFSISRLLNPNESYIFQIYKETEHAIYALRRYDDKFRTDLKSLDILISKICGVCFSIFSDNENYAKAYLVNRIVHILYTDKFPWKKDALTEILEYGYGFLSNMKCSLKDLCVIHAGLVTEFELGTLDLEKRFLAAVSFAMNKEYHALLLRKAEESDELKSFVKKAKKIPLRFAEEKPKPLYEENSELEVYGNYELSSNLYDAAYDSAPADAISDHEINSLIEFVTSGGKASWEPNPDLGWTEEVNISEVENDAKKKKRELEEASKTPAKKAKKVKK